MAQFIESLRTNRVRFMLVVLLVMLLPCYCVGGILLAISTTRKPAPSPTAQVTDVAQAITATSLQPITTPATSSAPSITPIGLAATPTQIGVPTSSIGTAPAFATFDTSTLFPDPILLTPVLTPGNVGGSPLSSCPDVDGTVTTLIRTSATGGTAPGATIYCRALSNPISIGVESVIQRGVIVAVELYAFREGAQTVTRFAQAMKVCLLGDGAFIFLDANNAPRSAQQLNTTVENEYTCADVPNAGTVVLTYR